jgi:lipid-A-disaccharide synthase
MKSTLHFKDHVPAQTDVLILTGEHSGEGHAACVITELLQKSPHLSIAAIGGKKLVQAGATTLFDLTPHSVIGFIEVIKHYGFFKSVFDELIRWIAINQPKVICFVDYPGLHLRIAARLHEMGLSRKSGGPIALYHYISPQIWAWKAGRRFKMAQFLDGLGVLYPFEVKCYADTTLAVSFVGNPLVDELKEGKLQYDPLGDLLLLPGSRRQPVSRILPCMLDAFRLLSTQFPELQACIICPDSNIRALVESIIQDKNAGDLPISLKPASDCVRARMMLTSSGTMSFQAALAGIPGVICYRAHPLTFLIAKCIMQVKYAGLANILMPENPPYTERLQWAAKGAILAEDLSLLLRDPLSGIKAGAVANHLVEMLSNRTGGSVADHLLGLLKG